MVRVLIAGLAAMLISILAGPRFIAFLRRKEYGQTIREEGPQHHVTKQGTPIMGGLLVLGAGTAAYLALARYTVPALTVLFVTLACGAIGFIDDFIKLTHRRSLGLNARWKLLLLGAITVIAVNVNTAMIPVPAARPSIPSVRFTPFAAPAMIRNRKGYQAQDRGILNPGR